MMAAAAVSQVTAVENIESILTGVTPETSSSTSSNLTGVTRETTIVPHSLTGNETSSLFPSPSRTNPVIAGAALTTQNSLLVVGVAVVMIAVAV